MQTHASENYITNDSSDIQCFMIASKIPDSGRITLSNAVAAMRVDIGASWGHLKIGTENSKENYSVHFLFSQPSLLMQVTF